MSATDPTGHPPGQGADDLSVEASPLPALAQSLGESKPYPWLTGIDGADFKARHAKVHWLKDHCMEEGVHWGVIKEVSNKPCLFLPGAQMLAQCFQLAATWSQKVDTHETPEGKLVFVVVVRCTLTHYVQKWEMGSGLGAGATEETRWAKKSPYNSLNSCLKMAAKRAYVGAAIAATGVAEIFTQDLEDDEAAGPVNKPEKPASILAPTPVKPKPNGEPSVPSSALRAVAPEAHRDTRSVLPKAVGKPAPDQGAALALVGVLGQAQADAEGGKLTYWAGMEEKSFWTTDAALGNRLLELQGQPVQISARRSATKPNLYLLKGIQGVTL